MTIAVLGANGQLGRDLCPRLTGEVVPLSRAEIDLDWPDTIKSCLATLRPDVVVNCAAYNFVDKAESEPEAAFRSNAWGVRELAHVCRDIDCRLVHFSTDYVFGLDSDRRTPLAEDDPPGPVSVYGLSKLAGEYLVRSASPQHLVVRTCGLYGVWGSGGKGGNFVETMLRLAGQGKPLRVVNDQRCTPTYTTDLAEAIAALVARGAEGLYHVTSSGDCTWYELAAEVFRQAGVKADLTPISSAEFGAVARRPAYSVLATDKLARDGISRPRQWPDALAAYLRERTERVSGTS
ncbi:MAG TPA: dTDP-4-dehydrorhamnose reductase [Fimbriiglobus sp.]|nr:dTDP-4-dehydrorhamnose reductase [Fimbriiglobus sp.]